MYYLFFFFFFNDTATPEIYTLSLHDALPICIQFGDPQHPRTCRPGKSRQRGGSGAASGRSAADRRRAGDRKSTRLNSSHTVISYAVFCLKKKKKTKQK